MSEKLVALVVDDDPGDIELLKRLVEELPTPAIDLRSANDLGTAYALLAYEPIDLVIVDYLIGAATAADLVGELRGRGDDRPIIVLTGQGDEAIAAALIKAGADDYLIKGTFEVDRFAEAIESGFAGQRARAAEARERRRIGELQTAKTALETGNARLAELYERAHEFVDHVSHEFRTPLTVVREFASIIQDGLAGEVSDQQRRYLDLIINRADDLSGLVDDMLDLSKLDVGTLGIHRADCTVAEIFERVEPTLERRALAAGAEVCVYAPPDLPTLFCDARKIERVITNLVVNALKYCNEPAQVSVTAAPGSDPSELVIAVRDNGPGISEADQRRIFERFRQLDNSYRCTAKGFGLGLSIVKHLVHLSYGQVDVSTPPNGGSIFSFTVPTSDRLALVRKAMRAATSAYNNACHVALVEARCDPVGFSEVYDELSALIQRQLMRFDLVLTPEPGRWLMVVVHDQPGPAELIERIVQSVQQTNGSRAERLPELQLKLVGTWPLAEDMEEFERRYLPLAGGLEIVHVG